MAENQNRPGNQGGAQGQGGGQGAARGGNQGGKQGGDQGMVSNVTERARDAVSSVAEQASSAGAAVMGGVRAATSAVRDAASHEGMLGNAASAASDAMERGGEYIKNFDVGEVTDEVASMIRRNPIPAMLVCIGIGFGLATLLNNSRS